MKLSRRGKHTKPARRARHTKRAGKHHTRRIKHRSKQYKRTYRKNNRKLKHNKRIQRGGAPAVAAVTNAAAEERINAIVTEIKNSVVDDLTVTPNSTIYADNGYNTSIRVGELKTELKRFAETHKKRIDAIDTIDHDTKVSLKKQIDELLILLLSAQFMYMKIRKIQVDLSGEQYNYNYFRDYYDINKIEIKLFHLTEDTKRFIALLGTEQKSNFSFENLKESLQRRLIDSCVIKNPTSKSKDPNKASSDLDAEQKYKLTQEIRGPPPAATVVAEAVGDAQTRVVTTGEPSVRGPGDDDPSLPPRVDTNT
jgi:hypothetical protein